jgi:hypothetical protein
MKGRFEESRLNLELILCKAIIMFNVVNQNKNGQRALVLTPQNTKFNKKKKFGSFEEKTISLTFYPKVRLLNVVNEHYN